MTFSRFHITVFLGIAITIWGLVLLFQGTPVSIDHLAPFGTVVGFLAVLGLAFEYLLWRQPWLHGWFVKRPDLRGTWRVELQSNWIDPKTGKKKPMIKCYMGVKQTLSTLQMHLMTPESESFFIAEHIQPSPSGDGYQVGGVYTNWPNIHLRGDSSEIHQGALILYTHGPNNRPETLTGEYWTDRETTGQLDFTGRVSNVLTRYEDAEGAF